MVAQKAKRTEHDKLILNFYNKIKTTWGIINKESGRNKKKKVNYELKKLKVRNLLTNKLMLGQSQTCSPTRLSFGTSNFSSIYK